MNFLYTLIVLPVESIIEAVFYFMRYFLKPLGVTGAIAGVSLAVNFLALPIYNMADAQQLMERETKKRLAHWVSRIRKTFSGDERFMMLSCYYRINHYHPAYALRETASILVQVPFFIAAYHFLSNCTDLKNASFWMIKDLGSPDALLRLGSIRLNALPIAMTVINIVSGIIYTKGAPLREKLQSPVLALLFLFLLYNSPSGLVFYWTLNNLFSLAKNAVKEFCPKPWFAVEAFICTGCVFLVAYVETLAYPRPVLKALFPLCCLMLALALPLGKALAARLLMLKVLKAEVPHFCRLLLFSCLAATFLLGFVLPASMIASSPTEFAFLGKTGSPLAYIWSSFIFAAGICCLWPCAIYLMAGRNYRPLFSLVMFLISVSAIMNAFLFKHGYGDVFVTGEVEKWADMSHNGPFLTFVPLGALLVTASATAFCVHAGRIPWLSRGMAAACLALCLYGTSKVSKISSVFAAYKSSRESASDKENAGGLSQDAVFHLSRTGRNVFTIFLDRSMGVFVPYIMRQFPGLKESYRGFTLYPNTLSFSNFTLEGAPALYGGYEYSPEQINKRKDELLNKKTNEAQLVIPRILGEAGWAVTLADPVHTSYKNTIDTRFLQDCPGARMIQTSGAYSSRYKLEHNLSDKGPDEIVRRGILRFFLLQCLYPPLRFFYYAAGLPFTAYSGNTVPEDFLREYSTLYYLADLTDSDAASDSYTIMYNLTPHNVIPLMEPDYHPASAGESIAAHGNIHTPYPYQSKRMDYTSDLVHYECNAASLLQIGKWLDKLKEMGVYDNTRIIIVGDHGRNVFPVFHDGFSENTDYGFYHTLLMVKDFGSDGDFRIDNSFMTNADTVYLSLAGLGVDMTNPYTGTEISDGSTDKAGGINVFHCIDWKSDSHINDTQFPIDINRGYHVSDDIYKESNWVPFSEWVREHPEDMPEGVTGEAAK